MDGALLRAPEPRGDDKLGGGTHLTRVEQFSRSEFNIRFVLLRIQPRVLNRHSR